jgi:hypothetical protein
MCVFCRFVLLFYMLVLCSFVLLCVAFSLPSQQLPRAYARLSSSRPHSGFQGLYTPLHFHPSVVLLCIPFLSLRARHEDSPCLSFKFQMSNLKVKRHTLTSLFRRAESEPRGIAFTCVSSVGLFCCFTCLSSVVLFSFALLFPSSAITTSLCPTEFNVAATLWLPLSLHASTLSSFCGFVVRSFSFSPCQT